MRFKSQSTGEVGKKRQWGWYFSIDVIMKLTVKWQRWRLGFYCFYGFFRSKEIGWYFCVWYCAVLCVAVPHFWCPKKCMQLLFLVSIGPLQGRPFTLMGFFLHQVAFLLRKETFFSVADYPLMDKWTDGQTSSCSSWALSLQGLGVVRFHNQDAQRKTSKKNLQKLEERNFLGRSFLIY